MKRTETTSVFTDGPEDTSGPSGSLVWLLAAVVLLESSMYSVLTPLLPHLVDSMDLSKSEAGILYSAYMLGSVAGAVIGAPVVKALGARLSARLALVGMATSLLGFALVENFAVAVGFRSLAGIAGGVAWVAAMTWLLEISADRRRGEMVGTVMGVSVFGTLIGPLLGNFGLVVGKVPAFGLAALACIACATALPARSRNAVAPASPPGKNVRSIREYVPALLGSVWVLSLMAFSYGAIFVLLPLKLASHDISDSWIGWIFVVCSGASAIVSRMSGKAVDRIGTRPLTTLSMACGVLALVVFALNDVAWIDVAAVIAAVGLIYALGLTPNSTAVSFSAERAGLPVAATSMLLLLSFSAGEGLGGTVTPLIADLTSDTVAFLALAAVTLVSLGAQLLSIRNDRSRDAKRQDQ